MSRIIFLLLLVISVLSVSFCSDTKRWVMSLVPIRYVRIEGIFQYISQDALKRILLPSVKTDYFSLDVQAIDKAARLHPWIDSVSVKRVWPDAVDISVVEQYPVVRWGDKGLLNLNGVLFSPDNVEDFKVLPLIQGPNGYETRLLAIMRELEDNLAGHDLHLLEFRVNERRSWDVVLKNGIEIKLGRNGQLKNFQRFLRTLDTLGQDKIPLIAKVDLRYPNGFAITWKAGTPPIDWKKTVSPQQI